MRKVKICAGWETSELITKRLLEQFKTSEEDVRGIEFVYDNSYDIIIYNNYITEEPKEGARAIIYFHEPSWVGTHQRDFSRYPQVEVRGYNKYNYTANNLVVEPSHLFYGGRGPGSEGWNFWTYENLGRVTINKTKGISTSVSTINCESRDCPEGCTYKQRFDLIHSLLDIEYIDFYGWKDYKAGSPSFPQKKDSLIDYKFNITIENSSEDNYISEKFYDAVLTNTVPIYSGCTNIKEIYPENGYILLEDITNVKYVKEKLNYINSHIEDIYQEMLPEVLKIKNKYFNSNLNFLTSIRETVV